MKRRWTIFALATALVVAGNSFGDELFVEGVKLVGGRILPELVKKCDRIDDEFVTATGKEAWDDVMRCLNGKIGPVNHHHASESGTTAKVSTAFGTTWNGPANLGPKVFPPRGKYVTDRPKNFVPGFKKITAAARAGDAMACGEVASAIFVKAITSEKYDAKKMFEYFRAAGIAGSADAIFMCGVCGYYGIGTKRNRGDAIKAFKIWQAMTHAEVREGGWVHRRLSE